jgi:hypothetical protein
MWIKRIVAILVASIAVSGCKEKPEVGEVRNAEIQAAELPASQAIAVHRDPAPQARLTEKSQILTTDPAFTALSDKEADWLKRNGFLSHEELRDLQALGERALLERSREKGDMAAATALGILRLRNGNTAGAIRSLDRAARSGSLYALEQLAYAELLDFQTGPGQRDIASEQNAQALFVARMEQARIMGDHRVDFYIEQVATGLDRQRYGDQILRQTTEFIRQVGSDAATRGVPAQGPDARPNIDLWQAAAAGPNGVISAGIR